MSFGAVAAIGGAVIAADAAGNAADAQKDAANQTNATNRAMSRQQLELQRPFRDTGVAANNRLMELMGLDLGYSQDTADQIYRDLRQKNSEEHAAQFGFSYDGAPAWAAAEIAATEDKLREEAKRIAKLQYNPNTANRSGDFGSLNKRFSNEEFEKDPGYQFRMDEGMKGVEGGAAARGNLLSGAALKAINKYGQGFASNEYGNAYSRFNNDQTNTYNRLAGLVNSGQGATNQMSNTSGQFAQNNANAMGAYGNAQAAGYMGQANALNQGIGNATNWYQNQQIIDKLQKKPGSNELMQWYE
jgi:hypothetical protein